MNKPICIAIKECRVKIVSAINESHLPPCVLEDMLNALYQQIKQAAQTEVLQAEKQTEEVSDNAGLYAE